MVRAALSVIVTTPLARWIIAGLLAPLEPTSEPLESGPVHVSATGSYSTQ
jgi:hypothetical protein